MKYFSLILILILTSCSLNKDSTYWNEDSFKNFINKLDKFYTWFPISSHDFKFEEN